MGSECSKITTETQYKLTSEEMSKMTVKMASRDIGGLYRVDWQHGHGIKVTLGLSAEVMFIIAGQALGIPWDRVRSAMGFDSCDHSVEAVFTIPERMLASWKFDDEKEGDLNDGTDAAEG